MIEKNHHLTCVVPGNIDLRVKAGDSPLIMEFLELEDTHTDDQGQDPDPHRAKPCGHCPNSPGILTDLVS